MAVWRSGNIVYQWSYSTSSPVSTGMGDVSGFNSRRRHFISVCNQPRRSTQPFILLRSINWVVSCNRMFASSHEWRRLVNAYGVKAWCGCWSGGVFASCITRVQCTLTRAIGWPQFALQHHWLLPINCHFRDCKVRWSGHRVSCAI